MLFFFGGVVVVVVIFSKIQPHRKCNNHISVVRDVEDGKSKIVRSVIYISPSHPQPARQI